MNCENIYCIYQKNDQCTLNEIGIDVDGHCNQSVVVTIPEDFVEKAKIHRRNLDDLQKYCDMFDKELSEDLEFEVKMKLIIDEFRKNHPEEFQKMSDFSAERNKT